MYILKNNDGSPRPCAIVPPASIANLVEVFERLDAGEPCRGIAMVGDDEAEFDIPEEYALNSLGRKARIGGNELFAKRLRQDLAYLARYEWGRAHTWNEDELGAWNDAVGVPRDETPVDPVIEARLRPVFPESDIAGILARYATRRRWAPVPDAGALIRILLNEKRNMPMRRRRPAKSGIALEVRDTGYGEMGVARDKRTGQTWMWPMDEERDRNMEFGVAPETGGTFVGYRNGDGNRRSLAEMLEVIDGENARLGWTPTWVGTTNRRSEYLMDPHGQEKLRRLDRRDIRRALDEELKRGGLPEGFDYPCHAPDGRIVWCDWNDDSSYVGAAPIMVGERPSAGEAGTLSRSNDGDGLRWWRWTDTNGSTGGPFPSFEQAMLDFAERYGLA